MDEAYALAPASPTDYGREAIEVLLKGMEDHRKDLVVIVAGYSQLMEKFIHSNPGLESRFNKYFYFEDYDGAQLFTILQSMCVKNGYVLTPEGEALARRELMALYEDRDENFGTPGMCVTCSSRRWPGNPTGWPGWRLPPGSS